MLLDQSLSNVPALLCGRWFRRPVSGASSTLTFGLLACPIAGQLVVLQVYRHRSLRFGIEWISRKHTLVSIWLIRAVV